MHYKLDFKHQDRLHGKVQEDSSRHVDQGPECEECTGHLKKIEIGHVTHVLFSMRT